MNHHRSRTPGGHCPSWATLSLQIKIPAVQESKYRKVKIKKENKLRNIYNVNVVSFCLSAVYGSLFLLSLQLLSSAGGALHSVNHFLGPPVGSTPLRKLWATVQRVATSLRQITERRCGPAPTRAYLQFLISRTRELYPPNVHSARRSRTASRRRVGAAASLAHHHAGVSVVRLRTCHPARSSGSLPGPQVGRRSPQSRAGHPQVGPGPGAL